MRIIIFGSNGMLGAYCKAVFGDSVIKTVDRKADPAAESTRNKAYLDASACTVEQICEVLEENCFVINCMGVIPQRSSDWRSMIAVNAMFPKLLHLACVSRACELIHISTDCVFSGKTGKYTETDPHDATDIYGITKSLGESEEYCVIRTSIIGEEKNNKLSLLEWVKRSQDKQIMGYVNHQWNGITCLQLAKVIKQVIEYGRWTGVRHVFSPESLNKYELVKEIISAYKLNVKVAPLKTEKIDRTLATVCEEQFDIPPIREQLIELSRFDLN